MNALEAIELQTAQAMFKQHTEANKSNGKKCLCNYCKTYRKADEVFDKIQRELKYNGKK